MTGDKQFDKWLIEKASDKVDYDLIHSAWLASRHETVDEIMGIIRKLGGNLEYPLACGQEDYENHEFAQYIIAAIRARYPGGENKSS